MLVEYFCHKLSSNTQDSSGNESNALDELLGLLTAEIRNKLVQSQISPNIKKTCPDDFTCHTYTN